MSTKECLLAQVATLVVNEVALEGTAGPASLVAVEQGARLSFELRMTRGMVGQVEELARTLSLLSLTVGPFDESNPIAIVEYTQGAYAQFSLLVSNRTSQFTIKKTMYQRSWSLMESTSLTECLAYIQNNLFFEDGEGDRLSRR